MNSELTKKIIGSLALVTKNTDRELLNIGITQAINELLDVNSISLFSIFKFEGEIECYIKFKIENNKESYFDSKLARNKVSPDSIPCFEECMANKTICVAQKDKNSSIILYPVTNQFDSVDTIYRLDIPNDKVESTKEFIQNYLEIYRNYLNLLIDSELDTLTGLLNRKTFDRGLKKILAEKNTQESIEEEERRLKEGVENVHWLAIADIDHFKQINDNYGHVYGDEVLLLLANIMRKSFRGFDILFRFGGEEFVIILRSTDLDGAKNALERFREKVGDYDFPQVGSISISMGFVEIKSNSIPTEILGTADEALYYSKKNGRNQVNQYEELLAEGLVHEEQKESQDIELF